MPELSVQEILSAAARQVLETMFFSSVLGESASTESPPEAALAVCVRFQGTPSGTFRLRVTSRAARVLAANFLGDDEDALSEGQVSEVVCELANMLCGSALSRIPGETSFELALPELGASGEDCGPATAARSLELEDGTATIALGFNHGG